MEREQVQFCELGSVFGESLRSLQVSLHRFEQEGKKSFLFTSAAPQEGKSIVVANLSVIYANASRRVLLIDADLRRPSQHKIFSSSSDNGLTGLLTGSEEDITKAIVNTSPGVDLLPCGKPLDSPTDLLGSDRMKFIIQQARTLFDVVLIDSPPVLAVADALLLAPLVDGALLVVKVGEAPAEEIVRAKELLQNASGDVVGVVLNKSEERRATNHPYGAQYIREPYKRFIENKLREIYDFSGVPIVIYFRKK